MLLFSFYIVVSHSIVLLSYSSIVLGEGVRTYTYGFLPDIYQFD